MSFLTPVAVLTYANGRRQLVPLWRMKGYEVLCSNVPTHQTPSQCLKLSTPRRRSPLTAAPDVFISSHPRMCGPGRGRPAIHRSRRSTPPTAVPTNPGPQTPGPQTPSGISADELAKELQQTDQVAKALMDDIADFALCLVHLDKSIHILTKDDPKV